MTQNRSSAEYFLKSKRISLDYWKSQNFPQLFLFIYFFNILFDFFLIELTEIKNVYERNLC